MRDLIPSQMPIGTIVNSYGEASRGKGIPKWLLRRAYASIRKYQRIEFRNEPPDKLQAIHSVIKVDNPNVWLSVTSPRATVGPLEMKDGHQYRALAWNHLSKLDYTALLAIQQYAYLLEGVPYDYGQLIDIQISQWFGWLPDKLSIFDFGRNRKVCSVGCHGALVAAYKTLPAGTAPRPLGEQYIEKTCPANFEVAKDFTLIAERSR